MSRTYYFFVSYCEFEGIDIGVMANEYILNVMVFVTLFWALLLDSVLWLTYIHWRKQSQLLRVRWKNELHLMDKIKGNKRKIPWILRHSRTVILLSNEKSVLCMVVTLWLFYVITSSLSCFSIYLLSGILYIDHLFLYPGL